MKLRCLRTSLQWQRAVAREYGVRRLDAVIDCLSSGFGRREPCDWQRSVELVSPELKWSITASSRRTPYASCLRGFTTALLVLASIATPAIAHPGSGIVVDRCGYVYFVGTGSVYG